MKAPSIKAILSNTLVNMKKALFLAIFALFAAGTAFSQRMVYFATEDGIDIVTIGKRLNLNPPPEAFYDSLVKGDTYDDGNTHYRLLRGGKHVADAYVSNDDTDRIVEQVDIWDSDALLSNGLTIGTPSAEAIDKYEVTVWAFLNLISGEPNFSFRCHGVKVFCDAVPNENGQKKIDALMTLSYDWAEDMEGEQPMAKMRSSDFLPGGKVTGFHLGVFVIE